MAAAPRVLLPGWDLQQLLLSEKEGQQQSVILANTDGSSILLHNGKTHTLAGQDNQKLLVAAAGQHYQTLVLPTANKFSSSQQEAQVMRLVVTADGQKLLLPMRQEMALSKNFVLQSQDTQKVMNGQTLLVTGPQDTQQVIMLGAGDNKIPAIGRPLLPVCLAESSYFNPTAGKRRRASENIPAARKLPCLSTTAQESPVVLMYQPVVANQSTQLMPTTLLQPNSSRASVASTGYSVMSSQQEVNTQSVPQTTHPLTTTSLVHTSSSHILTSVTSSRPSPSPSPSSTPTVVNGLVHLKSADMKKIVSPKAKKPPMDISCLTREGAVRSNTPPALLQVNKSDAHTQQEPPERQEPATEGKPGETAPPTSTRQDVVLVQTAPPTGMQRVVVIGEKGEVAQPQRMILPVAYDQQLVSMPIYRVGSSLGGLQPLQVLASLPSGGTAT